MLKKIAITSMSVIIIMLSFVSCDGLLSDIGPTKLEDSRFDGRFSYYESWKASDGINERFEYTVFEFDGTNKASFYTKRYSYYSSSGWSYTGDYIGDYYLWDLEFDIENGDYRWKLWKNSYSEWNEWENYSFSNDGNTLTLFNFYNIDWYDKVLTRSSARSTTTNMRVETIKTTNEFNALLHDKQLSMKSDFDR